MDTSVLFNTSQSIWFISSEITFTSMNSQIIFSQTCLSSHLSIAVTCFMRPLKMHPEKIIYVLKTLWIAATCQQRSLLLFPLSGRYWQVWLYVYLQCVYLYNLPNEILRNRLVETPPHCLNGVREKTQGIKDVWIFFSTFCAFHNFSHIWS